MEQNYTNIIESILFVTDKPIGLEKLANVLELTNSKTLELLQNMQKNYKNSNDRGLKLVNVAKGWQLRTKEENTPWLKKLENHRPLRVSQAALEVLAIIAYKQPITKQDIEKIRGVDSLHLLKTLLEKSLIKIYGRSKLPGKPLLYSTSNEFLEFFNLNTINDLPNSQEISSMFENTIGDSKDLENLEDIVNINNEELDKTDDNLLDEVEKISKELNIDLDLVQEKVDIIFEETYKKFRKNKFQEYKTY